MNRTTWAIILLGILAGAIAGMLLIGPQGIAFAQDDKPQDKPVDIAAITQPSPVVAAMPYQAQTDYEQDPFEPTKLRRTTMQVRRVLLVHQDGSLEIKDATN
ncbi:MAG: hypothetical protein KKI08_24965 [Armatimonadetes bacterium]|nr:hypothetical protein [Armatimonadota bacterium]